MNSSYTYTNCLYHWVTVSCGSLSCRSSVYQMCPLSCGLVSTCVKKFVANSTATSSSFHHLSGCNHLLCGHPQTIQSHLCCRSTALWQCRRIHEKPANVYAETRPEIEYQCLSGRARCLAALQTLWLARLRFLLLRGNYHHPHPLPDDDSITDIHFVHGYRAK